MALWRRGVMALSFALWRRPLSSSGNSGLGAGGGGAGFCGIAHPVAFLGSCQPASVGSGQQQTKMLGPWGV